MIELTRQRNLVSLQQKLDEYNAKFRSCASVEEVMATDHSIREAIESGQAMRVRSAGAILPEFELPDESGKGQSLDKLLQSGPLVLVVIRGSWCPFCRIELRELERVAGQIVAAGASLVVVTPETMESCRRIIRKNGLSFSLLSDTDGQLTRDLGLRREVPPHARAWLEKNGVDLHTLNADKSWALPIPARFVVGRDRRIAYTEANADYRRRGEPEELIPILERIALDSRL
jgi:peroxiredoxin